MRNSPSIFVTGASGFIGQAVLRELKSRGFPFVAISRTSSGFVIPKKEAGGICIHLAGENRAQAIVDNPIGAMKSAERLAAELFHANFEKIVLASSAAVYGDTTAGLRSETEKVFPNSPYGELKHRLEELFLENSSCVVARLSNVYGPGMSEKNLLSEILRQLSKRSSTIELGPILPIRDYIFIDDAAKALCSLACDSVDLGIYNIGTGVGTSVLALAELVLFTAQIKDGKVLSRTQKEEFSSIVLNNNKIQKALGWSPTVPLKQGIQVLIQRGT